MPCSTSKCNANRQIARKSTGPRTAAGKARSSRNALKHGFTATASSLTPLEDRDAYESYTQRLIHSLHPATAMEEDLAHRIADLSWRLRRIPDAESALLARDTIAGLSCRCARERDDSAEDEQEQDQKKEGDDEDDDGGDDDGEILPDSPARHLAAAMIDPQNPYLTLQRYESSLDRARSRALKELRQLQKDRRDHPTPAHEAPRRNEPTRSANSATPSPSGGEGSGMGDCPGPGWGEGEPPAHDAAALPNEPTAPICVHPRSSAVPSSPANLQNEPTTSPRSQIHNQNSPIEGPLRPSTSIAPTSAPSRRYKTNPPATTRAA